MIGKKLDERLKIRVKIEMFDIVVVGISSVLLCGPFFTLRCTEENTGLHGELYLNFFSV
jgi:hypothetical protein